MQLYLLGILILHSFQHSINLLSHQIKHRIIFLISIEEFQENAKADSNKVYVCSTDFAQ